jgi:hypothetical protein
MMLTPGRVIGYSTVALFICVALIVGGATGCKSWNRYQKRADAGNRVKVSQIEIRNQAQRVQIAKQQAQIRKQEAIGIRSAQDEIAKTLTPLYVQHEMTQVLEKIATSGMNNTVVYIPSGANGIPLVSTTSPSEVRNPDGSK